MGEFYVSIYRSLIVCVKLGKFINFPSLSSFLVDLVSISGQTSRREKGLKASPVNK